MKIGKLDFHEYVGCNLKRHKLGFVPCEPHKGSTDSKTYIKAPIATNEHEFLVYLHELGHCKAKQLPDSYMLSFYGKRVTEACMYNEVMAWDYALRYFRRIGLRIDSVKLQALLDKYLGSYVKEAEEVEKANEVLKSFNNKFGLNVQMAVSPIRRSAMFDLSGIENRLIDWKVLDNPCRYVLDDQWTKAKQKVTEKKSDKWKPWHDLQEANARKYWRNK